MREHLASVPRGTTLSTAELATAMHKKAGPFTAGLSALALGGILTRLAKWMGAAIVTHDGEIFFAYGKQKQRWRWHGQQSTQQET